MKERQREMEEMEIGKKKKENREERKGKERR